MSWLCFASRLNIRSVEFSSSIIRFLSFNTKISSKKIITRLIDIICIIGTKKLIGLGNPSTGKSFGRFLINYVGIVGIDGRLIGTSWLTHKKIRIQTAMLRLYRSQSFPLNFKRLLNQSNMILMAQTMSVIEVIIKKLLMILL